MCVSPSVCVYTEVIQECVKHTDSIQRTNLLFCLFINSTNFLDILTMVNNAVSSLVMEIGGQEVCKQVPSPCFTLRKRLLFGPKTASKFKFAELGHRDVLRPLWFYSFFHKAKISGS